MTPQTIEVNAELIQDPWQIYEKLRADGPVHKIKTPSGITAWLVIDYACAKQALSDPVFSKDLSARIEIVDDQLDQEHSSEPVHPGLLGLDPPDHTRLRKLTTKAFTAQASAKLRPRVEEIVAGLIDRLRADTEIVDLVSQYAYPLPIAMISELLGVPEADRDRFGVWSRQIMDFQSPDTERAVEAASVDFRNFVRELVAAKRAEPGPGDLLDELIAARDDGDKLTDEELFSLIILLLIAGHETTVNLISTATAIIAADPELRARVLAQPDAVSGIVEETLRFDGPAGMATMRHTSAPVALGDVQIPAGELVIVGLGAANRDPARFPDPDRFDPDRATTGHLGFGHGIHFCVGAALARIEGEIAIRELFRAFPELAVADEAPKWRPSFLRGRLTLPARLGGSVA